MTGFPTLAGAFGFKCLLCSCVVAKGGRGLLGWETRKDTEKRGGIVKHFSEALRNHLLRGQVGWPGGPCTCVCSIQEGNRYHRPSAPAQDFSWWFALALSRRP